MAAQTVELCGLVAPSADVCSTQHVYTWQGARVDGLIHTADFAERLGKMLMLSYNVRVGTQFFSGYCLDTAQFVLAFAACTVYDYPSEPTTKTLAFFLKPRPGKDGLNDNPVLAYTHDLALPSTAPHSRYMDRRIFPVCARRRR